MGLLMVERVYKQNMVHRTAEEKAKTWEGGGKTAYQPTPLLQAFIL